MHMALHTKAVEAREGDYFEQPLNRVARLLSAGYGGQVLLSAVTQLSRRYVFGVHRKRCAKLPACPWTSATAPATNVM